MKRYKYLTKLEKKRTRAKYANTKKGMHMLPILNRLVGWGTFCLFLSLSTLAMMLIVRPTWVEYVVLVVSTIAGLFFLIGQQVLRIKEYDKLLNKIIK